MAKYHKLVNAYQDWISEIKAQQAELLKWQTKIDDAKFENDLEELADCTEAAAYLESGIQESRAALTDLIRQEYGGVPFRAPRQAGIAGFWREAGLRPL